MMSSILILFWIGCASAKILPLELAKAFYIRNATSQAFPLSVSAYEELLYCSVTISLFYKRIPFNPSAFLERSLWNSKRQK